MQLLFAFRRVVSCVSMTNVGADGRVTCVTGGEMGVQTEKSGKMSHLSRSLKDETFN